MAVHIELQSDLSGVCKPGKDSTKRYGVRGKVRHSRELFLQRTVIAMMTPRGVRWRVSVRGSEIARRFASPMLSRIANKKEAEHASNAALLSVARLKASRAAGLAPAARTAGSGMSGLALNGPPGGGVDESAENERRRRRRTGTRRRPIRRIRHALPG